MSGWEADFNIESTKHLSKNIWEIIKFDTLFELMLGPWAHLEPPWHLKGQGGHSKLPLFKDFVSKWDPIGTQKITLGASRWPSELPMTSFGGDFLRTYSLHEIRLPKTNTKSGLLQNARRC